MYVRWKKRPLSRRLHPEGGDTLSAILVYSERRWRYDLRRAEPPRQRIVGYLASIKSTQLRYPLSRAHFWEKVEERLTALRYTEDASLVILSTDDILAAIEAVVPRPDPEEVERAREGLRRFGETLRAMIGPRRRSAHKFPDGAGFVGTTTRA
jgi:hypothetical protein